jgi:hypothetical protein
MNIYEIVVSGPERLNIESLTNLMPNFASSGIHGPCHRLLRQINNSALKQSYTWDKLLQPLIVNKQTADSKF